MSFNPASFNPFANVTHVSDAQAKRIAQADDIDHQPRRSVAAVLQRSNDIVQMIEWLGEAASRFARRTDEFSFGKPATCRDIAEKLQHFGCFASERQEGFARKLIEWSLPRGSRMPWEQAQEPASAPIAPVVAPTPAPAPETRLDRLFALMQRLSKLTISSVIIARKNGDSLCWVKLADHAQVVGKIEGGKLTVFSSRMRSPVHESMLRDALLTIERDPEAAAVLHGKLSGRCAVCSRDLTDPESIARGIGPICVMKAGF